jgi:hypothetical protein
MGYIPVEYQFRKRRELRRRAMFLGLSIAAMLIGCLDEGPWSLDDQLSRDLVGLGSGKDSVESVGMLQVYCSHKASDAGYPINQLRKQLKLVYETSEPAPIRDMVAYARTARGNPYPRPNKPRSLYIVLFYIQATMRAGRFDYLEYDDKPFGIIEFYPSSGIQSAPGVANFFEAHGIRCPDHLGSN